MGKKWNWVRSCAFMLKNPNRQANGFDSLFNDKNKIVNVYVTSIVRCLRPAQGIYFQSKALCQFSIEFY